MSNITTIKIPRKLAPLGHRPHTTGSGKHQDRRTKRNRTRGDQKRRAIGEYS